MITGKVKRLNYDNVVEGPEVALKLMLNKSIKAIEL